MLRKIHYERHADDNEEVRRYLRNYNLNEHVFISVVASICVYVGRMPSRNSTSIGRLDSSNVRLCVSSGELSLSIRVLCSAIR